MPLVLILWIRLKGVAGPEYARLNTGGIITPGSSGNGAPLTLNGENVGNKDVWKPFEIPSCDANLPWF
jgi:hypothetical protein